MNTFIVIWLRSFKGAEKEVKAYILFTFCVGEKQRELLGRTNGMSPTTTILKFPKGVHVLGFRPVVGSAPTPTSLSTLSRK